MVGEYHENQDDRQRAEESEDDAEDRACPAAAALVPAALIISGLVVNVGEHGAEQTREAEDVRAAADQGDNRTHRTAPGPPRHLLVPQGRGRDPQGDVPRPAPCARGEVLMVGR